MSDLESLFPGLHGTDYQVTSPPDPRYNCIAWTATDSNHWWWPDHCWPAGAPREETIDAFRAAFASLGYAPCDGDACEPGSEKIALFSDAAGLPRHAARQLPTGRWTSKLGELEDIEHELRALEGNEYGTVALLMKRPIAP